MKKVGLFLLSISALLANDIDLNKGLSINYQDSNDEIQKIVVKRDKPKICETIKFGVESIYGGNYANDSVPKECKSSFVKYFGKISPIKFADGVETYGENEVVDFIQKSQNDKSMMLVDSRTEDWYMKFTLPSAKNFPYTYAKESQYPDEFKEMLNAFGVTKKNGKYDFSKSKTLLLFCNGIWCGQSPIEMKELINIGYPKEKLKWYRGGIQTWLSLGLPVITPQ